MTIQEFEDALDSWLAQAGPDDAVPMHLREESRQSLEKSERLREWMWLHREIRSRRIQPPAGFADRVMQRLAEAPLAGRRSTFANFGWAGAMVAVAAAVVVSVLLRNDVVAPDNVGPIANSSVPQTPEIEAALPTTAVNDTLTFPGVSQLAQVFESPARILPTATLAAGGRPPMRLLSGDRPQMRSIIGESADVLRTAGSELSQDMQPVALSAVSAFRFLWDESDSSPRKPST